MDTFNQSIPKPNFCKILFFTFIKKPRAIEALLINNAAFTALAFYKGKKTL